MNEGAAEAAGPRRGARGKRLALGCAGLLLAGVAATPPLARGAPALLIERSAPRRADALIVLGGDHRGGRIDAAAALFAAGHVPEGPFLISGGPLYAELTWAEVMRGRALERGVPPARIWLQDRSRTTVEDAAFTVALLDARLASPPGRRAVLLLVTSAWHSRRAAAALRAAAGERYEVVSCPAPDPDPRWWRDPEATRALVTEVLKYLWPG